MRRVYIDNLRWISVLLLIPYHAAMAWNTWGEPNYIYFESDRRISSIVVFLSPYFMPLLFLIAGISTKAALRKRSIRQYILERARRLLLPFVAGTLLLMPPMTYIADRFHGGYQGNLFEHYRVFFTRYTDLTGADGGFSVGQFWFVLYLFVISLASAGIIALWRKFFWGWTQKRSLWQVFLWGLPLPLLGGLFSVGGKSLAEYGYIFLAGYGLFSDEHVVSEIERYRWFFLCGGFAAAVFHVYLFVWSDVPSPLAGTVMKYLAEGFMPVALLGIGKRYLTFRGKMAACLSRRSYLFYAIHFFWVVLLQYLLADLCGENTLLLYLLPVLGAYGAVFLCGEVWDRAKTVAKRD